MTFSSQAEGLGWFTAVIAISDELPPRARARLLGDASHAALGAGDLHALFAYAQQALEIGGPEAPAIAYIQLAHWHIWNNEPQRVLELGHQALAAEDPVTQIIARGDVVMALGALGAAGETRAQMAEQVKQAQALADPVFLASTYSNGGWALAMLGHTEEAIEHLEIAFRYADAAGAAMANVLMSSLALELDDPDRAAELLRIAIPMARNQLGGLSQAAPMVASAKLAWPAAAPEKRPNSSAQSNAAANKLAFADISTGSVGSIESSNSSPRPWAPTPLPMSWLPATVCLPMRRSNSRSRASHRPRRASRAVGGLRFPRGRLALEVLRSSVAPSDTVALTLVDAARSLIDRSALPAPT